ncbi:ATP-binding protein [Phaeovibrio sulfidiphilus]|uniref:ATP-binding protein n=1 Tax=Phaeovibrio sulfidiphilus TaxID=1220600 RepID=A0A8J7CBX8_9PROT|nr:ATP-binding protein [Phaeovibrio sulfidiphilus]MBE1236648.1 ATP-binding protein [Phaeovibrio sulfidiphilus]
MQKRTFPAELESLAPIRDFVRAQAAPVLDTPAVYKLVLAVDELSTNVVIHGYGKRGIAGHLDVAVSIQDGFVSVTLEDQAPPFDASVAALPTPEMLSAPLEDRHPGGLGLMLIRDGVDIFHYERAGDRNRNTLIKHLADCRRPE